MQDIRGTRSCSRACTSLMIGVVLACAVASRSPAQQRVIAVQAGVSIDHDSATVGDVLKLTVRIHSVRGASINFPAAVDSLGPVQSLEPPSIRNGPDSSSAADRIATYRLAAWDIGLQQVRLGDVLVQTDDGERRVALTLPSVFVRSLLPADTAKRIPKPARPLLEQRPPTPWWWWVAGAVGLLVLIVLAWWLSRRWRRGHAGVIDPYASAQASFSRVERLRLIEAGEPGRHAALMSDVLRHYLAERIATASLAQTSVELIAAVLGTPTISSDALHTLFADVDRVKFAAAPLSAERARAIGEQAKALVTEEHTRAEALSREPDAIGERAA